MLTDYHLHLRPDDASASAADHFTAENVGRYRAAADSAGIEELGVAEHIHRFREALDIWRHPFWLEQATDELDSYCEFVRSTSLKLGIEADLIVGTEAGMASLLEARDFDYVVGSVHFLGDVAVDHPDYDAWAELGSADAVWKRYFELVAVAARSGLFDILAHPDVVKVWGDGRPAPERDLRFYYEPAIEAIADSGIAVEVSTAGLRKPIGELYPAPLFAEMCRDAGAPFALSSDAHLPGEVGYEYGRAVKFLGELGVDEICVFERRRRSMRALG